ncbi:hypothetical protein QE152_g30167 [Popillia japonica]|uniref:Uncharacterized protein n=1 Tax=Popillia japonica TaxID=7064 RepID=A0AAW1JFP6_POPJA
MRLFSSSEDECEENDQNIETSVDGTVWQKNHQGSGPGRSPLHTIFREISGPTGYAKRNIMKGKVRSAFSSILDQEIMNHIKMCTESEARRVLGSEWRIMLTAAIPEVKVLDVTYHVNLTESLALKWYCPLGEKYEILGTRGSGKYALITM